MVPASNWINAINDNAYLQLYCILNIKIDLAASFTYSSTPLRLYSHNILDFQMNMKTSATFTNSLTSSFNRTSRKANYRVWIICTTVVYIIRVENNSHPFITLTMKKKSEELEQAQRGCLSYLSKNFISTHSTLWQRDFLPPTKIKNWSYCQLLKCNLHDTLFTHNQTFP